MCVKKFNLQAAEWEGIALRPEKRASRFISVNVGARRTKACFRSWKKSCHTHRWQHSRVRWQCKKQWNNVEYPKSDPWWGIFEPSQAKGSPSFITNLQDAVPIQTSLTAGLKGSNMIFYSTRMLEIILRRLFEAIGKGYCGFGILLSLVNDLDLGIEVRLLTMSWFLSSEAIPTSKFWCQVSRSTGVPHGIILLTIQSLYSTNPVWYDHLLSHHLHGCWVSMFEGDLDELFV